MKVVFRVDSSSQIGSGHLMRCLTLAKRLVKEKEADVLFVMRDLDGNLINLVKDEKFHVAVLQKAKKDENLKGYAEWLTVTQEYDAEETIGIITKETVDLLVVDSYAIDIIWESMIRPYVKKIMVIDDLANRSHDCDILLDQDYYLNLNERYVGLVPSKCKLLLGPQYALLRDEFMNVKSLLKIKDGNIKNIFIFFGGSDITNETAKAISAVRMFGKKDVSINVVVGQNNVHKEMIRNLCDKNDNINYFCQVSNISELMCKADIAIGAGGTTIWERCVVGLYSIVISIAENQDDIAKSCNSLGILTYLGDCKSVDAMMIKECLQELDGARLKHLSNNCMQIGKNYGIARFDF